MIEAENPIQLLCYEFVQDAMGAGKFRGGAPYRRDYRFLEEEGVLQIRNDRCTFRPFGLHGGKPGKQGRNVFNPDTAREAMTSKVTRPIHRSDVFRYETPGAGGWGDPLERDPRRVLVDVRNEYVSPEGARADYGVVIDVETWRVDAAATHPHPRQDAPRARLVETALHRPRRTSRGSGRRRIVGSVSIRLMQTPTAVRLTERCWL